MHTFVNQIVTDLLMAANRDGILIVTDHTVSNYCKQFNVSRETLETLALAARYKVAAEEPPQWQAIARACGALGVLAND